MPTYSYKCKDCGYAFEITGTYGLLFRYKPACPSCSSENSKKQIEKPTVIFKGKGFYVNDKKEK